MPHFTDKDGNVVSQEPTDYDVYGLTPPEDVKHEQTTPPQPFPGFGIIGVIPNTATYWDNGESDDFFLNYKRTTDKPIEEKTDCVDEKTPQTGPHVISSGEPTIPVSTGTGSPTTGSPAYVYPSLDEWTLQDQLCTNSVMRDANHVISVTRRLFPDPATARSNRVRQFWSKRHWRSRCERWREHGVNGDYLPCEIDMGDPNYATMPLCYHCHRKITLMTQVCLRNITFVPDDLSHW